MKRDFALVKHGHLLGELDGVDLTGLVDNSLIQYDAVSGDWQDVTLANLNSQLDHGTLGGLADDDHTQYVLRSILTTNGDLFTRTGGVIARLGVGSGSNVLGISGGLPAWRTLVSTDISDFTEAAQDAALAVIADSSSIDFTYNDAGNSLTATVITANPTGTIGLAAVNGTAATPMRSDAAPALSQAISPTWSATHTFSNVPVVPNSSWTYAKIQNVSATSRVLGRITAGAGVIEELTGANLATIIGTNLGANPSASVGLTAVNGSAATYMRSDGAPALSQAISPTMTGNWIFSPAGAVTKFTSEVRNQASNPFYTLYDATGATRQAYFGYISSAGYFAVEANSPLNFRTNNLDRISITATGNTTLPADNYELQLGASQDLRLFHDGTNSIIRNDTGHLLFYAGASEGMRFTSSGGLQIGSNSGTDYAILAYRNTAALACYIRQDGAGDIYRMDAAGGNPVYTVTQNRCVFGRPAKLSLYTVATLPTGAQGDTAAVSDALAPAFGSAVAGGGAVTVPVYYTGAAWFVG